MEIKKNLELLRELISCGSNIYTWSYDAGGQLLDSNCPEEALLGTAFSLFGCKDKAIQLGQDGSTPQVLGTAFGLIWGVDFERENGALSGFHVIGPAFFSDVSRKDIERGMRHYENQEISLSWKHRFMDFLSQVPVAQNIVFTRYLLMLHFCITGEKLDPSALSFRRASVNVMSSEGKRDRHKVWQAERAMLQMVRNGDLNYKNALSNSILISTGVPVKGTDPLRQAKTSTVVFTSIVSRAAIEGGLSPDEAYSVGDSYIQTVESAQTYDEVSAIPNLMYDDFVRRVYRCRVNPNLSAPIQKCCSYIEMHLDQKIRAKDLAELAGYTEYYLTHKFKEETGFSVNDYVKNVKMERAKILLQTTDLSVQEITEQLGFTTRSYFCRVFGEIVGCSPVDFRNRK